MASAVQWDQESVAKLRHTGGGYGRIFHTDNRLPRYALEMMPPWPGKGWPSDHWNFLYPVSVDARLAPNSRCSAATPLNRSDWALSGPAPQFARSRCPSDLCAFCESRGIFDFHPDPPRAFEPLASADRDSALIQGSHGLFLCCGHVRLGSAICCCYCCCRWSSEGKNQGSQSLNRPSRVLFWGSN